MKPIDAFIISDLHLDIGTQSSFELFKRFMIHQAPKACQLFILGDLFDVWMGDDLADDLHYQVASLLREYTKNGHKVYFMPGNRDFAIGNSFLNQMNAISLKDPSIVTINQQKILFMHGDLLCSDDKSYQYYRRFIQSPFIIKLLRFTSKKWRYQLGLKLRNISQSANHKKPLIIQDVNEKTILKYFKTYQADLLIHGHTHKPAIHPVKMPNGHHKRYVLGDWHYVGWYIEIMQQTITLKQFQ